MELVQLTPLGSNISLLIFNSQEKFVIRIEHTLIVDLVTGNVWPIDAMVMLLGKTVFTLLIAILIFIVIQLQAHVNQLTNLINRVLHPTHVIWV